MPSWAGNCARKRSTDVANHAAGAPIPDTARTSTASITMRPVVLLAQMLDAPVKPSFGQHLVEFAAELLN